MALDFNQSLLHQALRRQKARVNQIEQIQVYKVTSKRKHEWLYDIATSRSTYTAGWVISDKFYTKALLQHANIPTADGDWFDATTISTAIDYATALGFPVVLKPLVGSHGDFVYPLIESADELATKIDYLIKRKIGKEPFLIEKHIYGEEYRIFALRDSDQYAVVHRKPAQVVGDGEHSILALIQIENFRRLNPRTTCVGDIKLDDVLFDTLSKRKLTIEYVPTKDEVVRLRPSSNVSMGGVCESVTERAHSSVKKLIRKIWAAIPGLSCVGIDLICADITKPLSTQMHVICELNAAPGLSLHQLPSAGKAEPVADWLASEILFVS